MKNKITDLLNRDDATLKINSFCELRRYQKNALGNPVDRLDAVFSITHSSDFVVTISARDWRGVIEELRTAQRKAFAEAAETLDRQLENGYIG